MAVGWAAKRCQETAIKISTQHPKHSSASLRKGRFCPHLGHSVAEFLILSVNVGLREIGNTIRACSNRPLSAHPLQNAATAALVTKGSKQPSATACLSGAILQAANDGYEPILFSNESMVPAWVLSDIDV